MTSSTQSQHRNTFKPVLTPTMMIIGGWLMFEIIIVVASSIFLQGATL